MKTSPKHPSIGLLLLGLAASLILPGCVVYPAGHRDACYTPPPPRACYSGGYDPGYHHGGSPWGYHHGWGGYGRGCR